MEKPKDFLYIASTSYMIYIITSLTFAVLTFMSVSHYDIDQPRTILDQFVANKANLGIIDPIMTGAKVFLILSILVSYITY